MNRFYNLSKQQVLEYFGVGYDGLTTKQVSENGKKYGRNEFEEKATKSRTRVFFEQFQDLLVIILIIAAILSLFTGEIESTIVIFFVITLNAALGTYQHIKAEKSLRSLRKLSSPMARVVRAGKEYDISSAEITIGDIVVIKAGDVIGADGRIIYCQSLEVNESSLTGESLAIEKNDLIIEKADMPLADQKNMLFSGSLVTAGKGLMVVTKIGMETELGKIARLLEATEAHKTPLQIALDEFSRQLAIWIIIICLIIFGISLYRHVALIDALMFAVALAVAAIPEALSSIVTIVLAIGTQKMAEENAIVKELRAVEGLGCINVICSDKTGTLTQNRMVVDQAYIVGRPLPANEINTADKTARYLLMCCYLCNDSVFLTRDAANATELALLDYVKSLRINVYRENEKYPRLSEIPFDSNRKMMSTLNQVNGDYLMLVKGGVEIILEKSDSILLNGKTRRLNSGDRYDIKINNKHLTAKGYRTIAFAYREYTIRNNDMQITFSDESNLIFLGFVAIIDPPRKEAKKAILEATQAGIKPVMITGDHQNTAMAIAYYLGISDPNDQALTGGELDSLGDNELEEKIKTIAVYARVSPEHKIRIVGAWQKSGAIVAFIGDGVNDAPAIRQANIGIAMGKSGTEVSKDAAAIILTDDNYYTIVKAVRNGRKIYKNIQNAIMFLLSGNAAGLLTVLYTSFLSLPVPFAPVHLLFINLLTDSLPAIAIGMEENEEDLMLKPPRKTNEPLLSRRVMRIILFEGILIGIFTVLAYYLGLDTDRYVARTCVFGTLCMARLFHSFNCRGNKLLFRTKVKNRAMIFSFIIGMILINMVLFIPYLQSIFDTYRLTDIQIFHMFLFAVAPTIIIQILLFIRQRKRQKTIGKR
ncbi:MAG: cation-translocating P-type ATPase [Bacilli bacterium]|nr:cation-translocating P-type ATPase [Bacilli bacterium]MDD4076777.1 cation-translocating P-type ATPase [Bacilli bacterium]MDD4388060.1 cation-translocating P-type ATPase [Bacilli bacterium]